MELLRICLIERVHGFYASISLYAINKLLLCFNDIFERFPLNRKYGKNAERVVNFNRFVLHVDKQYYLTYFNR